MAKTALVISGGGSKGAFAVGVVRQLANEFPDLSFDILVGTSTGALIVPLVALDELDLLEQLYTSVKTDDIILKGNVVARLLGDNSLFDAKPLANLIKQNLTDERCDALMNSNKEVYLATTCLQTNHAVYFSTSVPGLLAEHQIIQLHTSDECRRAVMASACQPVFMPPIEVKKGAVPLRQYVDGGVREYAGLQLAIDAGADEIFVILLNSAKEQPVEKPFGDAFTILKQTIDIFTADVAVNDIRVPAIYNRALRYIRAVTEKMKADGISQADIDNYFDIPLQNPFVGKKPLKIHLIRPDEPLGGGPGGLEFDPIQMKGMLARGKHAISSYMASLPADGDGNV
jgi:NTE family protein